MAHITDGRLGLYQNIADELLSLSGGSLSKKVNKAYIVLERKLGKSALNKNAVTLGRKGITFMVMDRGLEHEAESIGLHAEKRKDYENRLLFPSLKVAQVQSNGAFFARLTQGAKRRSEYLQQANRT